MSAICGLYYRKNQPIDDSSLSKMLQALSHRGLDGYAHWTKDSIGFGIQKYFITPESQYESLPFYSSTLELAIVANARIDNRQELFRELQIETSIQSAISDSQLILYAYAKWGKSCSEKLVGDFVVGIWDDKKKTLIFITDPCGVCSIHYYIDDDFFAFSSEIKALHALQNISCQPNFKKIALIGFACTETTQTFFDKIFVLPPASVAHLTATDFRIHTYWEPDFNHRIERVNEEEYIEEFQPLFTHAIKSRLRSAYPVSCLLSGGLDSSAMTGMAAHLLREKNKSLRTMSAVLPPDYQGNMKDERAYIQSFQGISNITMTDIYAPDTGPFSRIHELVLRAERPDCNTRHYLNTAFSESAQQHGERVMLSGCFGEIGPTFDGTGYWAELLINGKLGKLMDEVRAKAAIENRSYLSILKHDILKPLLPHQCFKPRIDLLALKKNSIVRHDFMREQLGDEWSTYYKQSEALSKIEPDHRYNQWLFQKYIINLPKVVQYFVGCEHVRLVFPYLDKNLLSFCLALPGETKVNQGYKRYLIREGARRVMPEKNRIRTTKEPYSPDYNDRFNRQSKYMLTRLDTLTKTTLSREIINIDAIKDGLQKIMLSNRGNSSINFSLMESIPQGVYLLQFLQTYFGK